MGQAESTVNEKQKKQFLEARLGKVHEYIGVPDIKTSTLAEEATITPDAAWYKIFQKEESDDLWCVYIHPAGLEKAQKNFKLELTCEVLKKWLESIQKLVNDLNWSDPYQFAFEEKCNPLACPVQVDLRPKPLDLVTFLNDETPKNWRYTIANDEYRPQWQAPTQNNEPDKVVAVLTWLKPKQEVNKYTDTNLHTR